MPQIIVNEVEFLPVSTDKLKFYRRLRAAIDHAIALRASIAFWTIDPIYVSPKLSKLLSNSDSFLCTDIHLPTNIDVLDQLAGNKANLLLHLRKIEGDTEIKNTGMPTNLLHSKVLLFDMPDGTAELWVGSHNWTRRALDNINLEASLVLKISQQTKLYQSVINELKNTKDLCTSFNRKDVEYYKWLQGLNETKPLIELEGEDADKLRESEIAIFGTDKSEFNSINKLGTKLSISVINPSSQKEYVYSAVVTTASDSRVGILNIATGVSNSKQRYVLRRNRSFPKLEASSTKLNINLIGDIRCCVGISVSKQLNVQVLEPTQGNKWVTAQDDAFQRRIHKLHSISDAGSGEIELIDQYRTEASDVLERIIIKIPVPKNEFHAPYVETLKQKQETNARSLVTRKILRLSDSVE